jgi:hypothetical protein
LACRSGDAAATSEDTLEFVALNPVDSDVMPVLKLVDSVEILVDVLTLREAMVRLLANVLLTAVPMIVDNELTPLCAVLTAVDVDVLRLARPLLAVESPVESDAVLLVTVDVSAERPVE